MNDEKPQGGQERQGKYEPRMGCFAKMILTVVIIGVLITIAMAIHFWYLKRSNLELTLDDYLTSAYETTKTAVTRCKDKVLEWKKWFVRTEKTRQGAGEPTSPPQQDSQQAIHPEFQAAEDEFRAGFAHLQKGENNEAFERFTRAQNHLENYKRVNPNDPRVEEFEEELAKCLHAAMKDSKVR